MSDRSKKIFVILSIAVPFLLYCIYYYSVMVKNAPYRFTDFQSLTIKYGTGDSLINQYDSKTGSYVYLDDRDSIVKRQVKLNKDDLLYLHRKAADLGFWNFPDVLPGVKSDNRRKDIPRYYVIYRYKQKRKELLFDADFNGNMKLKDAAKTLIDEVMHRINDAEDRGK